MKGVMVQIARRLGGESWVKERYPGGAFVVFRNGRAVAVDNRLNPVLDMATSICADEDRATVISTNGAVFKDLRCARAPRGTRLHRYA